jgi:hypothetical protein
VWCSYSITKISQSVLIISMSSFLLEGHDVGSLLDASRYGRHTEP